MLHDVYAATLLTLCFLSSTRVFVISQIKQKCPTPLHFELKNSIQNEAQCRAYLYIVCMETLVHMHKWHVFNGPLVGKNISEI